MRAGLGLVYADLTDGLDDDGRERVDRLIDEGPDGVVAEDAAANSAALLEVALAGGDVRWPAELKGVAGGAR